MGRVWKNIQTMAKQSVDDAEQTIMGRSWWNPIEWLTPLIILGGGLIVLMIAPIFGWSGKEALCLTVDCLIVERTAWAAHRAFWRRKHRQANQ